MKHIRLGGSLIRNWKYIVVAAVFLSAAVSKTSRFSEFQATLMASRLIPQLAVVVFARCIIIAELALSIALLSAATRKVSLWGLIFLVSIFLSYNAWRWIENIAVPCTCFGLLFNITPLQSVFLNVSLLAVLASLLPESNVAQSSKATEVMG